MLLEPREGCQPWPGNSISFSRGQEQSGAVCLPVPACPRTPSPAARTGKTTFPLAGNPKQTHTRHRCVFPARGGRQVELCALKYHTAPTDPQCLSPKPNTWGCGELQGTCSKGDSGDAPWGDRGLPAQRGHPQDSTARHHHCSDPVPKLSRSPGRAQPRPQPGTLHKLQAAAKTPSNTSNPPDPMITQLHLIWVPTVSHRHPGSDSTLREGPDPAAGVPRRDRRTVRRGRTDRHHRDPLPTASEGHRVMTTPALGGMGATQAHCSPEQLWAGFGPVQHMECIFQVFLEGKHSLGRANPAPQP